MEIKDLVLLTEEPADFQQIMDFFNKINEMNVDSDVEFYVVEIKTPLRKDEPVSREIDVHKLSKNLYFNYFFVKKIQWA